MREVRRQWEKWKGSCFSGQVIITSHVICAFNLLCSISIAMVRVIGILSRTLGGTVVRYHSQMYACAAVT